MREELSRHWRPYLAAVVTAVVLVMGFVAASSERPDKRIVTAATAPVPALPPVAAVDIQAASPESAYDVADQEAIERLVRGPERAAGAVEPAERRERHQRARAAAATQADAGAAAEVPAGPEVAEPQTSTDFSEVENCSDTTDTNFPTPPGDPNGLDSDGDGNACESG